MLTRASSNSVDREENPKKEITSEKRGVKRSLAENQRRPNSDNNDTEETTIKRQKLTTARSFNGTSYYVGEKILAIYEPDGLYYEATICDVNHGGESVQVIWFNDNPLHRVVSVENIQRIDTSQFYVGEKIWAKYYPDGEDYIATIVKIDEDNRVVHVEWFNDNPKHRRIKISDCKKMTELDREEEEQNKSDLKAEVRHLEFDLRKNVTELVPQHHLYKIQPKETIGSNANPFLH